MWCACGVHVVCMWCACGVHVVCMCVHVVCMWCACGVHVCACGVHVVCMWCACGVHVVCMCVHVCACVCMCMCAHVVCIIVPAMKFDSFSWLKSRPVATKPSGDLSVFKSFLILLAGMSSASRHDNSVTKSGRSTPAGIVYVYNYGVRYVCDDIRKQRYSLQCVTIKEGRRCTVQCTMCVTI